jgi:hypothetical protein
MFTIGFFIAGHFNDLIGVDKLDKSNAVLKPLLRALYYLLPNLEHFNIRTPVVYGLPVPGEYVFCSAVYGALYITILLWLSCLLFSRKDL